MERKECHEFLFALIFVRSFKNPECSSRVNDMDSPSDRIGDNLPGPMRRRICVSARAGADE
jgi:hypothetical protein